MLNVNVNAKQKMINRFLEQRCDVGIDAKRQVVNDTVGLGYRYFALNSLPKGGEALMVIV